MRWRCEIKPSMPNERRLILYYQRLMMDTSNPIAKEVYRQLIRKMTQNLNGGEAC